MERERFLLPVGECAPDSRMRAVQYEYCRIYETADRGDENLQDGKMPGERGGKAAALTAHCGAVFGIAFFAVMFLLSVCFLIGDSYNPFLYFRF